MALYKDQLGRPVELKATPKKIVSIVPSQTELLFDLGLNEEVIGITKFCIHPEAWFRSKKRIGGTKQLQIEEIIQLQPDLIVANKEENVREQVEALASHFPVWISDVNNLNDACQMIDSIGTIVGKPKEAACILKEIETAFGLLEANRKSSMITKQPRAAYLIWKDPYMTVGGDSFINDMICRTGFENAFGTRSRYPETSPSDLQLLRPDFILLSSEPYPFTDKHIAELSKQLPASRVILVDGEMFSWYGSRLQKAAAYFTHLQQVAMIS